MSWFKNLKIRAKMFTGFTIVTVIGILLAAVGVVSILQIKSASEEVSYMQKQSQGASEVLNAHYIWRHELTEAVLTGGDFAGSLDPQTCALGKWLASDEARNVDDPVILDLLRQIERPHSFIHSQAKGIIESIQGGRTDAVETQLVEVILPKTQEVISLLTQLEERFAVIIGEKNQQIVELETKAIFIIMGVVVVAIILSTFMALYVSGLISKPLAMLSTFMRKAGSTGDIAFTADDVKNIDMYAKVKDEIGQTIADSISFVNHVTNIARELESVADGDLTAEIVSLSEKDVMGHSLKKMTDNLNNMFTEIQSATTQVSTGSTQVASGAQSLAQGSTEQAASVEELSSAITEIEEGTKANALTANKASALSVMIKENAEKGSRQMDEMITAVGEINEASKNINGIIKTIDDIAFQTNILALNAAVEAARAGQHGRGFAVVAEEVRNLASKSAEAARDTSDMIQNSMDKAELGARIAGDTAASLKKIVSGIDESSQLIAEIAKGSEEQSSGISQINMGIDQVTQVVQLNSATAEESAAASEELSGQSMVLRELVSQFKLKDGSVMHQRLPSTNAPTPKRLAMHDKDGFALTASSGDLGKY